MTNRDFYMAIVTNDAIPADLRQFASDAIDKMDARNSARAAKPSKAAIANEALAATLLPMLDAGMVYTAAHIAEMLDLRTESGVLSTSKATAVAKVLVEQGAVSVGDYKVPKKGKCKGYTLVVTDEGEDE